MTDWLFIVFGVTWMGWWWHGTTSPDSNDVTTRRKQDDDSNSSHSSSHFMDTMKPNNGLLMQHGMWPHLYHKSHYHHVGVSHGHEDSPSPISSDSESSVPHSPPHHFHTHNQPHSHRLCSELSPPHYSSAIWSTTTTTLLQFVFTPSMRPLLGPLQMLNIHSANASCAPSPIWLPLLSLGTWGHGSPSWAWQQVGCKDDAELLRGIFLFLEVVESLCMCFLNMYTSRSFVTSFLPFLLLYMSWSRAASLFSSFFIVVYICVPTVSNPQCHSIRICCIQPFRSDLMEGNYLKWSEHYQIYIWWDFRGCF